MRAAVPQAPRIRAQIAALKQQIPVLQGLCAFHFEALLS
jgi:hypothetical protein